MIVQGDAVDPRDHECGLANRDQLGDAHPGSGGAPKADGLASNRLVVVVGFQHESLAAVGDEIRAVVGPHDERFDLVDGVAEELGRELAGIARHGGLLHEARQAAVGEDFAAGLAARAVHDFV